MNNEIRKRNTKQKAILLDYFIKNKHKHLSIDTILYDLSASSNTKISQATIYRLLNALNEDGLIRKINIDNKKGACYQYIDKDKKCFEHYHLICNKCGTMIHFDNKIVSDLKNTISLSLDFDIDTSKIVFYGLCNKCKN